MPTALRSGTRGPCTRGTFPWSTDLACSCRIPCVFATGASLPNITCALHRCWSRLQSLKQPQVLTLFAWHVAARESDSVVDWALKKKKKKASLPHSLIRRKELGSGPVLGFGARLWEAHVQSCQGYICFRIYFCLPMECATSVVLQLSHAAHHFLREKFSPGLTHSHTKPFSPTHFLLWLPKEEPFCPQAESHSTHGTDSIRPFQT